MEQSLIAAVSGIQANQTYLDVIGSNIANANTTAYKSQSAVFTDLLAEQVAGATAPLPNGQGAGINPMAIGSGVRVGAVTDNQTQGTLQQTNQPTDVAIQGQGFLVAKVGGQQLYTRAGHLTIDANGNLATPTGGLIQGWEAQAGKITTTGAPGAVTIPNNQMMPPSQTTTVTLTGNIDPTATSVPPVTVNIYDQLGNAVPVTFNFTAPTTSGGSWGVTAWVPTSPSNTTPVQVGSGSFSFSGGAVTGTPSFTWTAFPSGYQFSPAPSTTTLPVGFSAITNYAGQSSVQGSADGYAAGSLVSFSIGSDGVITGAFTNGQTQPVAQLALASFANPGGLADQGNLMYATSGNSGAPNIGTAGSGGRGTLVGGALEGSNVNLAGQLTDLIVAQEAYQADTKVVSTTAQTLQALMAIP